MRESGPLIVAFPGIAARRVRCLCRSVANRTTRQPEWRLVVAHATRGVDGNDREATARALYDFVREVVTYQREPHEHIQAPAVTLRLGMGGCDEHARARHPSR